MFFVTTSNPRLMDEERSRAVQHLKRQPPDGPPWEGLYRVGACECGCLWLGVGGGSAKPALTFKTLKDGSGGKTEDPSGCGAASPSQGRWVPDSLRPALSLGGV